MLQEKALTTTDILAIIGTITGTIGTIAGLTALGWDFYKWRRSTTPRLKVSFVTGSVQVSTTGNTGGQIVRNVPGVKLVLRNPTDRMIRIESLELTVRRGERFTYPHYWNDIKEIPPQQQKALSISMEALQKLSEGFPTDLRRSRVVLTDELGNEYTTVRLTHLLNPKKGKWHLDI
jgi:hypothetical protein